MSADGPAHGVVGMGDADLVEELRRLWDAYDPVPDDLVERIGFALELEDLEVEMLDVSRSLMAPAGHRSEEKVRTMTFTSESLSVMVSITPGGGQALRIDGWIDEGGGLEVELRVKAGARRERADPEGRFAFDGVGAGMVQFVFHPTAGAHRELSCTVVTPAVQV